ncbi:MAG: branched-chain-amino-acid transaminase [Candidatus Firestonebacteria bacterium]
MSSKIYINGKFFPKDKAVISVFDHGLLYGDGVFEGIRSYNGRVFKLDEHIDRLYESAKAIMLEIPLTKRQMKEAVLSTFRINKFAAYIRLVVTRGTGDLGLDPRKCPKSTIIIIADKIVLYSKDYYEKGLKIVTATTCRNIPEALNSKIKSLNYLNNILAKIEANNYGALEAIMLTYDGYVTECTGDNIFIVKDNCLITPPSYLGLLEGITRKTVMDLAIASDISVKEAVFTRYDLYTADECFLTGTAAEIVPVVEIDGRVINDGKVGDKTALLMKKYRELTANEGTPIYAM